MHCKTIGCLLAGLCACLALETSARAEGLVFPGTRPLGAGGAMRGYATGDAGPMLNPSGISLIRSYTVEGGYQYGRSLGSHDARISAVDSTSGFNLGGALFYTYHRDSPANLPAQTGHLVGGSLSFPFLDKIFLGANLKYVRFCDAASTTRSGFTFDAGLTVRPFPQIALGAVAYNLRDLDTQWAPRGYGGGLAVLPMPMLLLVFDTVWTKVQGDPGDHVLQFMGGGEFSLAAGAAVRAGGGRDGSSKNAYFSAGVTAFSAQLGAIDIGLRQDVSGEEKTTIVGVSLRLFVPST
ncbi:MAG: hypothetical protein JXP73_18690 [Deltaproteobacteria bacterium]|nr:hypothetical protein [Deltaproteobacteria bacterium]